MTGRPRQIFFHLAGCAVFLALPILFSPESLSLRAYLSNPPTQREIIAYLLLVGAFYANYYGFIPRFYFRRKYLAFIAINLGCLALIIFVPTLLRPNPNGLQIRVFNGAVTFSQPPPGFQRLPDTAFSANRIPGGGILQGPIPVPGPQPPFPGDRRFRTFGYPSFMIFRDFNERFFLFLVALFLALLLKIRDRWIRAEEEKLHAELSYLKAQVNPHFLFNTLNSIYSMALSHSDQTAGAIVRLSSMMRYVLVEAGRDKVPLDQEINHLTDYIELQQTRFEATLHIDKAISGPTSDKYIVPLLLIPFVENAFKYGVNPENPSTIKIRIEIIDDELRLLVVNNKVAVLQPDPTPNNRGIGDSPNSRGISDTPNSLGIGDTPSGLGISNTRRRLQMLYPGRHSLHIEDGRDTFSVSLSLKGISA